MKRLCQHACLLAALVALCGCPTAADDDDSAGGEPAVDLVAIEPGTFEMGCTAGQLDCDDVERPVHTVTLTRGFGLGRTEVTQGQWEAATGTNPSHFADCGADCPVEQVTWYEALAFANLRSVAEGLPACFELLDCEGTVGLDLQCAGVDVLSPSGSVYDCEGYRLPTEAELEYASRAGTDRPWAGGDEPDTVAWFEGNSDETPHAVATLAPNGWGLHDLSGNVWEQAWDRWSPDYYGQSPGTDPEGPAAGELRSIRGGCWVYPASSSRVASRDEDEPGRRVWDKGLRLARTLPPAGR